MKARAFHFLFAFALFFSGAAAAAPMLELGELFSSPAGQVIAREMGLSVQARELLASGGSSLTAAENERFSAYLEEVRTRYLDERPDDEDIFEKGSGPLKSKQDKLLAETLWMEAEKAPEFIRFGEQLRNFRGFSEAFVAGAPTLPPLPPHIEVSINKAQAGKLFEFARSSFAASFAPEQLQSLLEALARGDLSVLTPETKLALKAQRKDASILRNAFSILGDSHNVPAAIQAYAADFGHLNDAIEAGLQDPIEGFARDLRKSLDPAKLNRALGKFEPTSRDAFDRYTRGLTKNLRGWAGRERLPVEEFHDMRKELKEYMNLLSLYERAGSDPIRKAAYDFLYQLNEQMGLLHDGIVAADLRGEINYKKQIVDVPERFRQGVLDFLDRFSNGKS